MTTLPARRLAGFRFEVAPPPLPDVLPRMDVAVFVGFAASGPLHRPVVVEDPTQFAQIFGPDLLLAWDPLRGESIYAHLASAVRAFFRNGGRRCWVVRVAATPPSDGTPAPPSPAVANRFPVPGLAAARLNSSGDMIGLGPALVQARSEGSWSDTLRVGAALISQPLGVTSYTVDGTQFTVELAPTTASSLVAGDLLRLQFPATRTYALVVAQTVEKVPANSLVDGLSGLPLVKPAIVRVTSKQSFWFQALATTSPPVIPTLAYLYTGETPGPPLAMHDWNPAYTSETPGLPPAVQDRNPADTGAQASFKLDLPFAQAPTPGTLLRLDAGATSLWLTVQSCWATRLSTTGQRQAVEIVGTGAWYLGNRPVIQSPPAPATGERLAVELWARQGSGLALRLGDLACAVPHPYFLGGLPTDAALYDPAGPTPPPALWGAVADPRFPLAALDDSPTVYLPLGLGPLADPSQFQGALPVAGTPLERDGLAHFQTNLFLDPLLADETVDSLIGHANFLRFEQPQPRQLRGIYAALEIEEATLIAVPDVVQRGWVPQAHEDGVPPAGLEAAPPEADCWPLLPPSTAFDDCALLLLTTPVIDLLPAVEEGQPVTVSWSALPNLGVRYTLEEATRPDFGDAAVIYSDTAAQAELAPRGIGTYYYRVRAHVAASGSAWSPGVGLRVGGPPAWLLNNPAAYQPDVSSEAGQDLQAFHRALLTLCAARADLFALLSLPDHYREDAALEHVSSLKGSFPTDRLWSFGALYHPWLTGREDSPVPAFRTAPPEGAICGMIARRTLARGAWIAPANEPLQGPVALAPLMAAARLIDLQSAGINPLRQVPQGFLTLSAFTLSDDPDFESIHVRRLLILLRRLALRRGAEYVFEPNDVTFRRAVRRGFELLLGDMFLRGAFAGATPDTAFRVVTSDMLNTPTSVDQGRFIVELQVAPAQPLVFLTVRLVQTGDQSLVVQER